jgi:ubiquinone/menaquinone biosynthesis C-methylase UbiE
MTTRAQGWEGWDAYAPFYDWENARTVARRDVGFWQRLAAAQEGRVLELGCGTGRITLPVVRAGAHVVGVDRSAEMLARGRQRMRRAKLQDRARLVRGDIRALPFRSRPGFQLVMAPYGILQSLTRERDLGETLRSVARVLRRGGLFGIDLVPDRRRRLTIFDHEYIERRGRQRRVHRFSLTFRTLSVPQMAARLEAAGFRIQAVLGDYQGGPWDSRADVWVILAQKR